MQIWLRLRKLAFFVVLVGHLAGGVPVDVGGLVGGLVGGECGSGLALEVVMLVG